jgi:hypothetical protein
MVWAAAAALAVLSVVRQLPFRAYFTQSQSGLVAVAELLDQSWAITDSTQLSHCRA